MKQTNQDILSGIYRDRDKEKYFRKYDAGLVLVIGGGDFYSGSPALSAMAAFRAGADMVRVIAPKRASDIIASFSPDLAAYPLEGSLLQKKHLPTLISMTESAKAVSRGHVAVVIGGGTGRSDEVQETILEYLSSVDVPVVIDADAIHALSKKPEIISGRDFLITPHTFEFFVLTGKEIYKLPDDKKIEMVRKEAELLGITILLKGKSDVISNGKEVVLNNTGTPYMSVGGTGDTLAGICGALLSRGIKPVEAACAAAYINGKAGEMAAAQLKDSMTASDVIKAIPKVLY